MTDESRHIRHLVREAQIRLRRLVDRHEIKAQRQIVRDLKMALEKTVANHDQDFARAKRTQNRRNHR